VTSIGILEGARGVNWRLLVRVFLGWVATLLVTGLLAALLTAIGLYTPNKVSVGQRNYIAGQLNFEASLLVDEMNASNVNPYNATLAATLAVSAAAGFWLGRLAFEQGGAAHDGSQNWKPLARALCPRQQLLRA
jgi:hypothetical protein